MNAALYPPTQLYLPLAICLTFLSIVTSVILSERVPKGLRGQYMPRAFLIAMALSFIHICGLLALRLAWSFSECRLSDATNIVVHLIVLFLVAATALPIASGISSSPIDSAIEKLKTVPTTGS